MSCGTVMRWSSDPTASGISSMTSPRPWRSAGPRACRWNASSTASIGQLMRCGIACSTRWMNGSCTSPATASTGFRTRRSTWNVLFEASERNSSPGVTTFRYRHSGRRPRRRPHGGYVKTTVVAPTNRSRGPARAFGDHEGYEMKFLINLHINPAVLDALTDEEKAAIGDGHGRFIEALKSSGELITTQA